METLLIGAMDFKIVAGEVIKTVAFGMGLPTGDVGTDVNLSATLFRNGHPN